MSWNAKNLSDNYEHILTRINDEIWAYCNLYYDNLNYIDLLQFYYGLKGRIHDLTLYGLISSIHESELLDLVYEQIKKATGYDLTVEWY